MALSSRPIRQPQFRTQSYPKWNDNLVYSRHSLQGMEGNRLSAMDSRKMYVLSRPDCVFAETDNLLVGSGKTILWYVCYQPGFTTDTDNVNSSSIIHDIQAIMEANLASMVYFYCDFRDHRKQSVDGFLASLLIQLCAQSDPCRDILFSLYLKHARGTRSPSCEKMTRCLIDMLICVVQEPTYIVVDALDECPGKPGLPSSRATLLRLFRELVNLRIPNLHICILSDLEPETEFALYPLASRRVCLHQESGHSQDIIHYLRTMLRTHPKMKGWKADDKEVVINTLFRKAEGVYVTPE
jgi:hypothetical protein